MGCGKSRQVTEVNLPQLTIPIPAKIQEENVETKQNEPIQEIVQPIYSQETVQEQQAVISNSPKKREEIIVIASELSSPEITPVAIKKPLAKKFSPKPSPKFESKVESLPPLVQPRPPIRFDPIGAVNLNFDFLMEEESSESDQYDSYGIINYDQLENEAEVNKLIDELNMMQMDINYY